MDGFRPEGVLLELECRKAKGAWALGVRPIATQPLVMGVHGANWDDGW